MANKQMNGGALQDEYGARHLFGTGTGKRVVHFIPVGADGYASIRAECGAGDLWQTQPSDEFNYIVCGRCLSRARAAAR